MKKKILSILLIAALTLSSIIPVMADEGSDTVLNKQTGVSDEGVGYSVDVSSDSSVAEEDDLYQENESVEAVTDGSEHMDSTDNETGAPDSNEENHQEVEIEEDATSATNTSEEQRSSDVVEDESKPESIVGSESDRVPVGGNVTASFDASTGTLTFYSQGGLLNYRWKKECGVDVKDIKSITVSEDSTILELASSGVEGLFSGLVNLESIDLSKMSTVDVTRFDWMFCGCESLSYLDLSNFDTSSVKSMREMFYNCKGLVGVDLSSFDTSNTIDMNCMFSNCSSLTSLDLSVFDTSNVTDMHAMFSCCKKLTSLDLSSFDTSNVTSMGEMFRSCEALMSVDLSSFNTTNVTNMSQLFCGCKRLTSVDLSSFNTTNVTNMNQMFYSCESLTSLDLSNFNMIRVESITEMFGFCKALTNLDLSGFYAPQVTSIKDIFHYCYALTSLDLSGFNAPQVTTMEGLFSGKRKLVNLNLSDFDTSNVTNMNAMFEGCECLTSLDLSSFDTSNVTDMAGMFSNCYALASLDLSSFDTSNVTNMEDMFDWCKALMSLDLSNFDTSNVTNMGNMFYNCRALMSLDLSHFDTSNVTDMGGMFRDCSSFTNLDLSNFDTSNVTDMGLMFSGCRFTSLDLSSFDTSHVTSMSGMFDYCYNLTTLDLSTFDTSNVTNMNGMFSHCYALASIDLSTFDTSNVTSMGGPITVSSASGMFSDCRSLTSLDLSNFDTSNVTSMYGMFRDCTSLTELHLSNFNTSNVTNMASMFLGCESLSSLDLSGFDTVSVSNIDRFLYGCTNLQLLSTPGNNAVVISLPHKMYDRSGKEYDEIPILTKSIDLSTTQVEEDPGFTVCDGVTATFDVATGELVFDSDGGTLCRDWIQKISISKNDIKIIKAKNIFSRIVLPADSSSLFSGFDSLIKLDLSCFDTSNVTNMNTMFKGCSSLTYLNLNNINMSNVRMMDGMFNGCRNIKRVDLPVSVTKMVNGMFSGCDSLTDIYFNGTDEQWNNVSKEDQSIPESVTVHFSATRVAASQTHYSSGIYYGGTGLGKTNEEQIREYYRLFASAIDSYMKDLNGSVRAEAKTDENVRSLREVDEAKKQPALTVPATVTDNRIINAAYAGLAEFYNRFDNDHPALEKINLSLSMTEIENKIINEIYRASKIYDFYLNHDGYTVHCNIYSMYHAFSGSITVGGYDFQIVSDVNETANTMAEYLKILNERAEQVSKDGLKEYMKTFNKVTCITSITEETFTGLFNKIYDYMLDKGYGKITKYASALYRGYKIAKDVTALEKGGLSDKLNNSLSLYDQIKNMSFSDSSIRNEALKTSLQRVESARADLENALYNYTYHPDEALDTERGWFDKFKNGCKRIIGKCPVDFTIYDENGNVLGWTNGSYCDFEEPIYIEMSGDVENIYIPDDIQVNVVTTATGDGSMSYMVEQYNGETIIGRLNYYDVPLTEGESYTQSLPAGSIIDESITLVGSEGSEISGSEYIDANTDAICSVSCDVCDGGEIYGAGEYIRGDYAELIAYAETGYSFAGWYIDDVLVSCDEVYRCAVTGDLSIYASFTEMENPQEITCEEKVIKRVGDEPFSLNASTSGNSTLYYYSENEEVATVSDDGMVSILNAGDTLIYAVANATNEYESSIKTISLTVIEANEYIDVSELTISLSKSSYTYNGKARKPGVTVKNGDLVLTAGSDYTVSYANNVNAGTASVTVTGTGWYTGEKTLTFQIKKAAPKLVFAESEIRKSTQDSAFTNGLTKTTDGTVSFSSGNKSVATVNATSGKVTIKGPGTTTITVNAAEGSNYKAGSSSYILTVTGPLEILSISDNYYGKSGTTAAFHIEAAGTGDLSYQWQYRTASMSNWKAPAQASAKTADYSFNMKLSYDNIEVRCIVSDGSGNEVISETRKANIFAYTSQPSDATAAEGQVVNFTVSALGRGVTYQWYYMRPNGVWRKTTISGSKKAVLPITAGVNNNGTSYRCVITDEEGNQITSAAGVLTLDTSLRITGISEDAYDVNGESVTFHIDAVGKGTLSYQWQYKLAGETKWRTPGQASAKTADYVFKLKPSYDNIEVRCIVTDASGDTCTSDVRKANVFAITKQPNTVYAESGDSVTFAVEGIGQNLTYQWYYRRLDGDWKKVTAAGYNTASLTITAQVKNNGSQYRCYVYDGVGNLIKSRAAMLIERNEEYEG